MKHSEEISPDFFNHVAFEMNCYVPPISNGRINMETFPETIII